HRFSLTLSQPQVLPLAYVPAEHSPGRGAFSASTVQPGQQFHGTVYFRQERSCGENCRGLVTIPFGDAIFVFPVEFGSGTRNPAPRPAIPPSSAVAAANPAAPVPWPVMPAVSTPSKQIATKAK